MTWILASRPKRSASATDQTELRNLRDDQEYDLLLERIREAGSGKRIFYVPNIGNWGDGLIHEGTVQFFHEHGIEYTQIDRPKIAQIRKALEGTGLRLSDTLLIAGGGGAFCETWPSTRNFLAANAWLFDHVVLLPTTFELPPLDDIDPDRITYFSRDRHTSQKVNPMSVFCHDMAFYLELTVPVGEPMIERGNFFRDDKEQHPDAKLPADNLDLSLQAKHLQPALPFFQILAPYRKIYTDRMHIAIAGSMLGREVALYPGSYFKSTDVFRSSIEPNYPATALEVWK